MLNIYILITWTQCKVAGLQMLSAGPHIPFQDLNMPVRGLKMIIFAGDLLFFAAHEKFMDDFLFFVNFAHSGETYVRVQHSARGVTGSTCYLCVCGYGLVAWLRNITQILL